MNIGIIGLPSVGKKTLFELLVGPGSTKGAGEAKKIVRGVAEVRDPRFDRLLQHYQPTKETRARIDVLLAPRIEENAVSQGDIFKDLAEVDVFCHVVRGFEDDSVYHMFGSVDPVRDIQYVNGEFILHDLLFVEKRIDRLDKEIKKQKDEKKQKEKDLLVRLKQQLDEEVPLRLVDIDINDELMIKSYPLLSRRAMIVVHNTSDSGAGSAGDLREKFAPLGIHAIDVPAKIEQEIDALDSAEEREEFMSEMGISETALHALTGECINALGLISFFTAGPKELRQWFTRKKSSAVEAAGKIHTDLARGFIRAEVIHYDDLVSLGSEEKVKSEGKLEVRGKDYEVIDGDILFVRFNV